MGSEAHAKVLALKRGVEWESLDLAGRAEMVSAAMIELGHLGAIASGKMLAEAAEFEEWDKLTDEMCQTRITSSIRKVLKGTFLLSVARCGAYWDTCLLCRAGTKREFFWNFSSSTR